MITTPRFVFLHLHKSGGTFVNACLLRYVSQAQQLGYHLPRQFVPHELANLPVLGLVRSPWSYYVSWYTFQSGQTQPNALYRVLSEDGTLSFADVIRNMLSLGRDDALLDRVQKALPTTYTNRGLNLPGHALEAIRSTGLGFYSFLHDYIYGDQPGQLLIGKLEHLRIDFPRMLELAGQPVCTEMRDYIAGAPALNTSRHGDFRSGYDDALADLVAVADRPILQRYGYTFDG